MTTKKCKTCNKRKPLEQFHRDKYMPDGRHNKCAECTIGKLQEYRKKAPTRYKNYQKEYQERNRQFLFDYLSTHPCVDCGETDVIVLEFEYVHGEKKIAVPSLMAVTGYSLDTVKTELAKCEVRCANCRKRKTAREKNWWVVSYLNNLPL